MSRAYGATLFVLVLVACLPAAPLRGPAVYCVTTTWIACDASSPWRWQSGDDVCACDEACGAGLHCPNGTACTLPNGATGECEAVGE